MNAPAVDPALRTTILDPPIATQTLPGIGGRLRARPEDFVVDEIAAYAPDGREERHLMVRIEKRGIASQEAVYALTDHARVSRHDAGMAGRKDTDAVTRQWITLPWAAREPLETFEHDAVRVLEVHPHGQKLRTGHLHGNRFALVVRDLAVDASAARHRIAAKLDALRAAGGLENLYGGQRFGREGSNLERGLQAMRAESFDRRHTFLASAAQAGVFNLYVQRRRADGGLRRVLAGDVLRKVENGGMFVCDDAAADQLRLDAGELQVTGPLPGGKTRRPPEGTPSASFEDAVLAELDFDYASLQRHGKRLPGSRRPCVLDLDTLGFEVEDAPAHDDLGAGLCLRFTLPAGSFATQVLRELQDGTETAP